MNKKYSEKNIEKKPYDTTLTLKYNDDAKQWQIGNFVVDISLTPALFVNNSHNINAISINVTNKAYDPRFNNFAMGFDSVGADEKGAPILYTKFADALKQLEKNKENIERYLHMNLDISVLNTLTPVALEFEKRADGRTPGHEELRID